jgi:hypothetical protein
MPDHELAEQLLAIFMRRDRAAAVVGDLLERVPRRGGTWFWLALTRTAFSSVWRDLSATPLQLAGGAVLVWFGYMLASVLLVMVAGVGLTVAGLVFDVATAHTGMELVERVLRLVAFRLAPSGFTAPAEVVMALAVAPYLAGTRIADVWRERSVALVVAFSLLSLALVVLVPFAGYTLRVEHRDLPAILSFMLAGVMRRRAAGSSPPAIPIS